MHNQKTGMMANEQARANTHGATLTELPINQTINQTNKQTRTASKRLNIFSSSSSDSSMPRYSSSRANSSSSISPLLSVSNISTEGNPTKKPTMPASHLVAVAFAAEQYSTSK